MNKHFHKNSFEELELDKFNCHKDVLSPGDIVVFNSPISGWTCFLVLEMIVHARGTSYNLYRFNEKTREIVRRPLPWFGDDMLLIKSLP